MKQPHNLLSNSAYSRFIIIVTNISGCWINTWVFSSGKNNMVSNRLFNCSLNTEFFSQFMNAYSRIKSAKLEQFKTNRTYFGTEQNKKRNHSIAFQEIKYRN